MGDYLESKDGKIKAKKGMCGGNGRGSFRDIKIESSRSISPGEKLRKNNANLKQQPPKSGLRPKVTGNSDSGRHLLETLGNESPTTLRTEGKKGEGQTKIVKRRPSSNLSFQQIAMDGTGNKRKEGSSPTKQAKNRLSFDHLSDEEDDRQINMVAYGAKTEVVSPDKRGGQ